MPTFLDLFAGCGGFSSGLRRAGLKSVGEVELDGWAAESLRHNFQESHVLEGDIREVDDATIRSFSGVDLIVGGPPCQGFSVAGSTQFGIDDPRNDLVQWFTHWVQILRPQIAIIENVPNILTKSRGSTTVLDFLDKALLPCGYTLAAKILTAAEFGVPQLRRRAFIVASARGVKFEFPKPRYAAGVEHRIDLFERLAPFTTVLEAISDLPDLEAGQGTDDPVPYKTMPNSAYQTEVRSGSSAVTNHIAMRHTDRLIERFKIIKPGQSLKDVPMAHGQVAYHTGKKVENPFKYNNYRLDAERPSLAIPASFQSLFLHPFKDRNLTAREAARLMGFLDTFEFKGKRTTMSWERNLSQYNQIGNAVCPPVAMALGECVLRAIQRGKSHTRSFEGPARHGVSALKLKRSIRLPQVNSIANSPIASELTSIGQKLIGSRGTTFNRGGFIIPIAALPAALFFTNDHKCAVCSAERSPFARHTGEMAFLISKEDLQSLIDNEQDHGLDYHLRVTLGIDHQVGHLVGEQLAEIGLVELVSVTNDRTGRNVRGIRVRRTSFIDTDVCGRLRQAISPESVQGLKVG